MKYQCYYNKLGFVGGVSYIGKRVNTEVFDTEEEAEKYCYSNDGIQPVSDDYIGNYPYEEDSNGKYLRLDMRYEEVA